MENVTKALLIAAGVMVGTIIIVIGVYLFVRFRNISESYDETITVQEIAKINKDFDKYQEKGKNTAQEVVAAATTADSINERYEDIVIKVTAPGLNITSTNRKQDYVDFIKTNLGKNYSCTVTPHPETKMVGGKEVPDPYSGIVENVTFTEIY